MISYYARNVDALLGDSRMAGDMRRHLTFIKDRLVSQVGSQIRLRAAVCLKLGALALLDVGLYSLASSRQPSGGSVGAVIGPCIEGNYRAWGRLMNSVDDGLEYRKAPRRQTHAGSDYHTIVALRS